MNSSHPEDSTLHGHSKVQASMSAVSGAAGAGETTGAAAGEGSGARAATGAGAGVAPFFMKS